MFKLEHCIENVYSELCQYTHVVNEKFKYFLTLLDKNCIIDKCAPVDFFRKIYNKKSSMECELIVYVLDNVVNSVKSKYTFYC